MKIYIGIATKGRPQVLAETLKVIQSQVRLPDKVLLCPAGESDLPKNVTTEIDLPIEIVSGPVGLCAQRNAILSASQDADLILFIDDDFFMASNFISNCESLFESNPDIAMATGKVSADGISGPGFSPLEAKQILGDIVETEQNENPKLPMVVTAAIWLADYH